jgi:hypothetical protein
MSRQSSYCVTLSAIAALKGSFMKTSTGVICFALAFAGVALMYVPGNSAVSAPASKERAAKRQISHAAITLEQRSRRALDAQHTLYLHISDITRGQVMTWISDEGKTIFGPISMYSGQVVSVTLAGERMQLRLKYLENQLIGTDYAHFELEEPEPEVRSPEPDRIET